MSNTQNLQARVREELAATNLCQEPAGRTRIDHLLKLLGEAQAALAAHEETAPAKVEVEGAAQS
jgi:hypothetical protein